MMKIYLILGAVIVALLTTSVVLWSRLEAKDAKIASLTQQLEVAAADAVRWQAAADQRQGIIDRQAATLRRLESDGQAARRIAAANADKAAERIAALEVRISQLKETAHARPQDVRLLGPLVRDALPSLQH